MNLPNQYFQDFPIEFKEINIEDFPHFEQVEKLELNLNSNGYIGNGLKNNINLEESNTIVLNAGVGSGKTTAIINLIKDFYDAEREYLIFVASPFVSLVEQYYNDIQSVASIPENDIYRYENIGESSIDYLSKKVHVITANTLLGNPGEDSFLNSQAKREYLDNLVKHCKDNNIQTVFIYDEIHDAVHNFKEKYIFNLWKWHEVIHKNFIISATFSEASKIVIEYIAELTQSRIKILECSRERNLESQSELYLHFDDANSYDNSNGTLCEVLNNIFSRELDVDILCHSKKLAKEICSNRDLGAGELLYNKYGDDVNECTSGLESNQRMGRFPIRNRYDKNKCNVGTNFKTGVSIEKENHAFVIIMPPFSSRGDFKNFYGIFSGGVNDIIQALARKRKKGEIHIILPRPKEFDFNSLPFEGLKKETFENYYKANQYHPNRRRISRNGIRRDREKSKYVPFGQQDDILWDFYSNELKANVLSSITYVDSIAENRQDKVRLEFPEYKLFKLEEGENYLAQKIKFFGDDFSSFITYCAFTNQFVNCSLVHVSGKPVQWIKEDKIAYILNEFYKNYFSEDWLWSLRSSVSDKYLYFDIKNELFKNHKVLLHSNTGEMRQVLSVDKELEPFLLALTQKKLYPRNQTFLNSYEPRGYVKEIPLSRGDYFRFCIAHANNIVQSDVEDSNRLQIALAYSRFYYFLSKVQNSIETLVIKGKQIQFIRNNPNADFVSGEDIDMFTSMINTLIEKDYFLLNEIFDFKKSFTRSENQDISKQINAFYNIIKKDFFDLKDRKLSGGENVKEIISFYEIPELNMVMDLISPIENLIPEENMPTYKVVDGILQKNI